MLQLYERAINSSWRTAASRRSYNKQATSRTRHDAHAETAAKLGVRSSALIGRSPIGSGSLKTFGSTPDQHVRPARNTLTQHDFRGARTSDSFGGI
jgi:hypothetical protein